MYEIKLTTFEAREAVSESMRSGLDFYNELKDGFAKIAQEAFMVITLNQKNKIIDQHIIGLGSISKVLVHPREVYRVAIQDGAASAGCRQLRWLMEIVLFRIGRTKMIQIYRYQNQKDSFNYFDGVDDVKQDEVILRIKTVFGNKYIYAEPAKPGNYAHGGNFLYTSNGVFPEFNKPIPLHDRQMDLEKSDRDFIERYNRDENTK